MENFVVEHFNHGRWSRTWWTNNYKQVEKFSPPRRLTKEEAEEALAAARAMYPNDQYRVAEAL